MTVMCQEREVELDFLYDYTNNDLRNLSDVLCRLDAEHPTSFLSITRHELKRVRIEIARSVGAPRHHAIRHVRYMDQHRERRVCQCVLFGGAQRHTPHPTQDSSASRARSRTLTSSMMTPALCTNRHAAMARWRKQLKSLYACHLI